MEIENAIFQDLGNFGEERIFKMAMAGLPNGVRVDPQGSTARFQGVHIKML